MTFNDTGTEDIHTKIDTYISFLIFQNGTRKIYLKTVMHNFSVEEKATDKFVTCKAHFKKIKKVRK